MAQETTLPPAPTTCTDMAFAANNTCLGYVVTGNYALDKTTEGGLRGLGIYMQRKTNVENEVPSTDPSPRAAKLPTNPVVPYAVDLDTVDPDMMALLPFIYFAVDPNQAMLSDKAIEKLNDFMANGGLLFIDTREMHANPNSAASRWLQRAAEKGLRIPPLIKATPCASRAVLTKEGQDKGINCSVLARSFYLLKDFPGRYDGNTVWAENASPLRHDGVSTVMIAGNDYAAAWAVDSNDTYMHAVLGDNPEKQRDHAFRFGVNLIMYAMTGNYKGDQVHSSEVIKRLGVRQP